MHHLVEQGSKKLALAAPVAKFMPDVDLDPRFGAVVYALIRFGGRVIIDMNPVHQMWTNCAEEKDLIQDWEPFLDELLGVRLGVAYPNWHFQSMLCGGRELGDMALAGILI